MISLYVSRSFYVFIVSINLVIGLPRLLFPLINRGNHIKSPYPNFISQSCVVRDLPVLRETGVTGDCSLVRRFCSPKVRESEIKGSSFRRFYSPKVRKSDDDFYSFVL